LLGKDEITNDMMSWNRDVTRLPEHMHGEYLTSLFLNNALAEGHFRVNKTSVALMDIQAPLMIVGTIRDHVSPWRSVYKIHLTTDTDTTFILTSGGHNAGIVSEPGHPHRDYQMKRRVKGDKWIEPEDWFKQAPQYQGSWWTAWSEWLAQQSSSKVQAPKIATKSVLCDAPGKYVLTRYDD
jgi:polyhydroxyalkanoate synthase